jgi:hypothetical protein
VAYDARVLRILIASPGDVSKERDIISQVISEWNYVNSRDRSIVLLPLRWETHAFPEMGTGPQASINRQIVDSCDMAVAVFWTRLGTATEVAASGTAEELTRVADAGKPVMLYFSRAKVNMQSVDLQEHERLMDFKTKLQPKALIGDYGSLSEFREKFRRQLSLRISDLIASDVRPNEGGVDVGKVALTLAEGDRPQLLASPNAIELVQVNCVDRDEIPSYGIAGPVASYASGPVHGGGGLENGDYYREMIDYFIKLNLRRRLWFAVISASEKSVRDIYLEILVRSSNQSTSINPPRLIVPNTSPKFALDFSGRSALTSQTSNLPEIIKAWPTAGDRWHMEVDIPIVQARRTVISSGSFVLKAADSGSVTFNATVYSSDTLPFSLTTELSVAIKQVDFSYRDILKQMIPDYSVG